MVTVSIRFFRNGEIQLISIAGRKDVDILKQVNEIIMQQNPQEKDNLLGQLSQVLEYHHGLNEADVVEGVRLLLSAALQEGNKAVRETFFSTIAVAVAYHHIRNRIDWDGLHDALPSLDKWELEYVLDILGFSGQVRYLPVLKKYARNPDPEIREWAEDAIENINSWVAHASASQKEAV
jgi:hypothetical protein